MLTLASAYKDSYEDGTLRAVNRVTINKLNGNDPSIRDGLQFSTEHLQHVLVCKKHAWEVETERQRMRLWRR